MTGNVVIGVGNELRRDDGFGPAVLRRLRDEARLADAGVRLVDCDGEPARLIEAWTDVNVAVVVDALHCPGPVGLRYELDPGDLSPLGPAFTSHGVGLAETVELAATLGRLPRFLVVLAAVGRDFGHGVGLSPALDAAIVPVAARAAALVLTPHLLGGSHVPTRTRPASSHRLRHPQWWYRRYRKHHRH